MPVSLHAYLFKRLRLAIDQDLAMYTQSSIRAGNAPVSIHYHLYFRVKEVRSRPASAKNFKKGKGKCLGASKMVWWSKGQ